MEIIINSLNKLLNRNNRRKATGIIVDSQALLRLSIPFFILLLSNVAIVVTTSWQTSKAIAEVEISDPRVTVTLLNLNTMILNTLSWGMFLIGVLSLMLWMVFSHRIFGPVVPIRRQLEKLAKGDYNDTIHLRKYDELKDVATDLNRLTEILKSSRK